MLHFEDVDNIGGLPPNQKVSQAWEDISLRLWGIHADDISLGICPLHRCPRSLCAVLWFKISSYFPSEEECVYNCSIRNSLRMCLVSEVQNKWEMGFCLVLLNILPVHVFEDVFQTLSGN